MFNFKLKNPIPEDLKILGNGNFIFQGMLRKENIKTLIREDFSVLILDDESDLNAYEISLLTDRVPLCLLAENIDIEEKLKFYHKRYISRSNLFKFETMNDKVFMSVVLRVLGKRWYRFNNKMFILERNNEDGVWMSKDGTVLDNWIDVTNYEKKLLASTETVFSPDPNVFLFNLELNNLKYNLNIMENTVFDLISNINSEDLERFDQNFLKLLLRVNYLSLEDIKEVLKE